MNLTANGLPKRENAMITTRYVLYVEEWVRGKYKAQEKLWEWDSPPSQDELVTHINYDSNVRRCCDVSYHFAIFGHVFNGMELAREFKIKAPKTRIIYKLAIEGDYIPDGIPLIPEIPF